MKTKDVEKFAECRGRIEQRLVAVQWWLRQPDRPLTTTANVEFELRRRLSLALLWWYIRCDYVNVSNAVYHIVDDIKDDHNPVSASYTLKWESGCEAVGCIPHYLQSTLPPLSEFAAATDLVRQHAQLADDCHELYRQSEHVIDNFAPWREVKKHCPLGGRQAYSALLVAQRGWSETTKEPEHRLFGWHHATPYHAGLHLPSTVIRRPKGAPYRICHTALRGLRGRSKERRGPAPSWKAGRQIRPPREASEASRDPKRRLAEYHPMGETYQRCARHGINVLHWLPSMVLDVARQRQRLGKLRLVAKIMGIQSDNPGLAIVNNVTTLFLQGIERLQGDFYRCPAVWRVGDRRLEGFVYLCRGYPGLYHPNPDESEADAIERIERQSGYYFARQRQDEIAKLTQRQRLARVLRLLRSTPSLVRQDSYDAGNCQPGTSQFCRRLGIDGNVATGRAVARQWRQARYPQPIALAAVADRAQDRIAKTVSEFFKWGSEWN